MTPTNGCGLRAVCAVLVLGALTSCGTPVAATSEPAGAPGAAPGTGPAGSSPVPGANPGSRQLRVSISAFSWQDNDPPNSGEIGDPVIHQQAGGTGTYDDPITVSVPGENNAATFPAGTRFYLPSVQRYLTAEDSGAPPGAPGTDTTLNVWIGGQDGTAAETDACEDQVTGGGTGSAELDPGPGLPVMPGPIYAHHTCQVPASWPLGRRPATSGPIRV